MEPEPKTYRVNEAKTRQEMDEIMDVIWAANHLPYEPFVQLFFPVLGYHPADREAAIAESKERFWKNHQADPSSHWYYVRDSETDLTVGCAQWELHLQNPFAEGPPNLRAPWWPDGEYREFCELILNQVYTPRTQKMTKPHVALNWMAVHPSYRRLGIGTSLMRAGIATANAHDVEAWMEASAMGRPLYEKHGFTSVVEIQFRTEKDGASDIWRRCEHEMKPASVHAMWRPRKGIHDSA
ncbi:hypothetical protein K491DRAFT_628904 [Lophiostoma macrostomum CBS 122681]|uniref:N-acetyltransferase domain-containing protein n=1 Tax=Lophiostoma macrostomum CBS 122681 TaxID=1314788 RepID=A0A6A6T8W4_9PLEO|nr:hypothetical protein K491DRAFT_628904 [Lophiostoma macrostomum CBS 122681]